MQPPEVLFILAEEIPGLGLVFPGQAAIIFWPGRVFPADARPGLGLAWSALDLAWPGLAWPDLADILSKRFSGLFLAWPILSKEIPGLGLAWPGVVWPTLAIFVPCNVIPGLGLAWPGVAFTRSKDVPGRGLLCLGTAWPGLSNIVPEEFSRSG